MESGMVLGKHSGVIIKLRNDYRSDYYCEIPPRPVVRGKFPKQVRDR